MAHRSWFVAACAMLAALMACPAGATGVAGKGVGGQEQAESGSVARFESADALLRALETADEKIRTLRAGVQHIRTLTDLEGNQRQVRRGTLVFRDGSRENGPKLFRVDFNVLFVDGVQREESQTFIFDGRVLTEMDEAQKFLIRREIVPPGQVVDPLAIGEGPFPLPIGQKRERILERFTVRLAESSEGWDRGMMPTALDGTHQLVLTPRKGTDEARSYTQVRLWYTPEDLLPRMTRLTETDGSVTEVLLINHRINEGLPDEVFAVRAPAGWDVQFVPYRGAGGDEDRDGERGEGGER